MSTELLLPDTDGLAPTSAPITLFGTDDPVAVVDRASTIATALADVIRKRQLFKHIGQSDHVFVEGWTLLGSMLGVFAEVEWSRPLEDNNGWESRAVARTLAGRTVGAAESMCSRSESKWKHSDDYAIRSMAQTRAVSKALRLPLGFIMELAGYSATPADEVPEQSGRGTESRAPARAGSTAQDARGVSASSPAPAQYRRGELAALMREKNLDAAGLEEYATLAGIPKGSRATDEQMDLLIDAVRGHGTDEPLVLPIAQDVSVPPTPQNGAGDVVEASPEDILPPKPGTPAYVALPAVEKAKARAYWSAG